MIKMLFTLVELLVVIAVIAILAALLLPSLSSAKEYSKSSVCMSNLKQCGYGFILYADEYGGFLPKFNAAGSCTGNSLFYMNLIFNKQYLNIDVIPDIWGHSSAGGVIRCPKVPRIAWGEGYSINQNHLTTYNNYYNISQLTRPSGLWLLGDGIVNDPTTIGKLAGSPCTLPALYCPRDADWTSFGRADNRHGGGNFSNAVLVDGHVASFKYTDLAANVNDIFAHNSK